MKVMIAVVLLAFTCFAAYAKSTDAKKQSQKGSKTKMPQASQSSEEKVVLKIATDAIRHHARVLLWEKEGYRYIGAVQKTPASHLELPSYKHQFIWSIIFAPNGPILDQGITVYLSTEDKSILLIHEDGA